MSPHTCPAPNCEAQVPYQQLACRPHWYSIPKDIRDRVWSAYRDGDKSRHLKAIGEAIQFLSAKDSVS